MELANEDRDILELNVLRAILPLLQQKKVALRHVNPFPMREYRQACTGIENCERQLQIVLGRISDQIPF